MSRIGNMPIAVPEKFKVEISPENVVTVSDGKTSLVQEVDPRIKVEFQDGEITLKRSAETKELKSLHGLYRSLLNNNVQGLTEPYVKRLQINGVGFRANLQGKKLVLSLGYSHPVEFETPEGITLEVPSQTEIVVSGPDKQLVGEFAAKIRAARVPDVYHGKGVKYHDEVLRIKEGKTGAGA